MEKRRRCKVRPRPIRGGGGRSGVTTRTAAAATTLIVMLIIVIVTTAPCVLGTAAVLRAVPAQEGREEAASAAATTTTRVAETQGEHDQDEARTAAAVRRRAKASASKDQADKESHRTLRAPCLMTCCRNCGPTARVGGATATAPAASTTSQQESSGSSSSSIGRNGNYVTLTFEGVGNNAPIGSLYEKVYGVTFDPDALALVDEDAGGSGNFAYAPSPSTTVQFYQKETIVMNVMGGFEKGMSFYYSSITRNGSVEVYDGHNGTGNVLASQQFYPLGFYRNEGDPTGDFNRWRGVGLTFSGVARSVVFKGFVNRMLLDDITLGSATSRCPTTNNTNSSTFELWNGVTNARSAKLAENGSYCLAGNWNVRVHTSHEMGTCGRLLIKFFTGRTVLRRQVEATPSYFLFGDNPVTRDVYGNTNVKPYVSSVKVVNGTTYCVRATEANVPGYSQVCFVHKC